MSEAVPVVLPPPRDWQVFEDFCVELFSEIWGKPAQKHGRTGDQHGVDLFGQNKAGEWTGVQCKRYSRALTEREILDEVQKATDFKPSLVELIFATTAPTNTKASKVVRVVTERAMLGPRTRVRLLAWSELVYELERHPELFQRWTRILCGQDSLALAATWDARAGRVFVGRKDELQRLTDLLVNENSATSTIAAIGAIEGLPGVGKSYLADRFFYENQALFPGGYARIVIDPRSLVPVEILIEDLAKTLELPPSPGLLRRVRRRLLVPRTLLHIENADSEEAEARAASFLRQLSGPITAVVTGRRADLGEHWGWHRIVLRPFDDDLGQTSRNLLRKELASRWQEDRRDEYDRLAAALGHLPLALHLAAGYLRRGLAVDQFLRRLSQDDYSTQPISHPGSRADRRVLAATFRISLDLLQEVLSEHSSQLVQGLRALGHAPQTGFGLGLGMAISGLGRRDFEKLMIETTGLHLVELVPVSERPDQAWRIHPLLAEWLAKADQRLSVLDRMSDWFYRRLDESENERGQRWAELEREFKTLTAWLERIPSEEQPRLLREAFLYAFSKGPSGLWRSFCKKLLSGGDLGEADRSNALWLLYWSARQGGHLDEAVSAAMEKLKHDQNRDAEREAALSQAAIADIFRMQGKLTQAMDLLENEALPVLQRLGDSHSKALTMGLVAEILRTRGELARALQIHREEQLPVYERLGDIRARAVALGQIVDILVIQGDWDEALRILTEEQLPAYDNLGDTGEKAFTMGQLVDVYLAQGKLDEALEILMEEQLPVYERLGDTRSYAVSVGKIADISQDRGNLDEALKMRLNEEIPVYERLGDARSLAIAQGKVADILWAQGDLSEAIRIRREEQLPVLRQLGDVRESAAAFYHIALLLKSRDQAGDRQEALRLLRLSLESASYLGIPETVIIAEAIVDLEDHSRRKPQRDR